MNLITNRMNARGSTLIVYIVSTAIKI